MDGKYAKYIPSSYGFITKLEIVDNVLHVHTKKTSKGEPHKYPLGEKFTKYSERLENQYKLITEDENAQLIKNNLVEDAKSMLNKILLVLSLPTILAACIATILLEILAPLIAGATVFITLLVLEQIALNKIKTNFEEEIDTIKTYLEERRNIETMSKKDLNVTSNLKSTTLNRISINQQLHEDALIPDVFDITLLDDLISEQSTKQELKKLLTNYKICVALEQSQVFVNPVEENDDSYEDDFYEDDSYELKEINQITRTYTKGRRPSGK